MTRTGVSVFKGKFMRGRNIAVAPAANRSAAGPECLAVAGDHDVGDREDALPV